VFGGDVADTGTRKKPVVRWGAVKVFWGALLLVNGMVCHRRASANVPHDVMSYFSLLCPKKRLFFYTNTAPPLPRHYFKLALWKILKIHS
jgi:hypothetical protein